MRCESETRKQGLSYNRPITDNFCYLGSPWYCGTYSEQFYSNIQHNNQHNCVAIGAAIIITVGNCLVLIIYSHVI